MDREDVVVVVGLLVIAFGIYLQFGWAMAMVFVGVVVVVVGGWWVSAFGIYLRFGGAMARVFVGVGVVVVGLVMGLWAGPTSGKR